MNAKALSRNHPSSERMTIARSNVGRRKSASNSTLNTLGLSVVEETFRYGDSSSINSLSAEILSLVSRKKLRATAMVQRHGTKRTTLEWIVLSNWTIENPDCSSVVNICKHRTPACWSGIDVADVLADALRRRVDERDEVLAVRVESTFAK